MIDNRFPDALPPLVIATAPIYPQAARIEKTSDGPFFRASLLPHLPWLSALLVAPFWHGGVETQAQLLIGILISISLVLTIARVRSVPGSALGRFVVIGGMLMIATSMLPVVRTLGSSPEWLAIARENFAFSFAPAETMIRAWQLLMLLGCFLLARTAAQVRGFTAAFSWSLAFSLVLLGGTELWRLADGRGVWSEVRHYPAGTFANRNHFAIWMVAGAMFTFGSMLRVLKGDSGQQQNTKRWLELSLYVIALIMAIGTVISCGSRGGLLALGIGLGTWAFLLTRRRSAGIAIPVFGIVLFASLVLFAMTGEKTMTRLQDASLPFKFQIWRESFSLIQSFPIAGIGLGAFTDVFTAIKTFHGEGSILFVENEYLQWVVEAGLAGLLLAACAVFYLWRAVAPVIRARNFPKSEVFYGAFAALVAISFHAFFEFIFHVMATALLAAALLGIVSGLARKTTGHKVEPLATRADMVATFTFALLISAFAFLQARAILEFASAKTPADQARALEVWPLNNEHVLHHVRESVSALEKASHDTDQVYIRTRSILTSALRWHPYNWELRLERAWLDLAFGKNLDAALAEARRAIMVNPLQPKIPLRFAAVLASVHPAHALNFIRSAPATTYEDVREVLRIAWSIERDPAILWELTPSTPDGLRALAQFAREVDLLALAAEAESQFKADGRGNRS